MRYGPGSFSVSVVIGSYNAAAWIRPAIESVLQQTLPATEVIVIDDGSADETAAIVRSYGEPVRLVQEEHRGRPHRNRGIKDSRGSFIAFIDADDLWQPTKLARQFERMSERNTAWVSCGADWMDAITGKAAPASRRALMEGEILESLFLDNFIVASTPVVSRKVLEEVGGFEESAEIAPVEDWDLWLRIAGRYPLAVVQEPLATVRLHEDSFLASTPLVRTVQSLENVIGRAVSREPARLGPKQRMALHNAYFSAGVSAFRRGLRPAARGFFLKAWRQQPRDVAALAYVGLTRVPPEASSFLVDLKHRAMGRV